MRLSLGRQASQPLSRQALQALLLTYKLATGMPLYVTEPIILEIGRITIWQSRLEAQITGLLAELDERCGPGTKEPLSARSGIHQLRSRLEERLSQCVGSVHPQFLRFVGLKDKFEAAVEQRNEVVHSVWGVGRDFDRSAATRISRIPTVNQERNFASVEVDDLRAISRAFEALDWEVSDILVQLYYR